MRRTSDIMLVVYQGIVLFVAVSPVALGGVRPLIVRSYREWYNNYYRNHDRNTELSSFFCSLLVLY